MKVLATVVRIGCALAVIAAARPAFAQPDARTQPHQYGPPPAQPIFGGGPGALDQSLNASFAIGAGHDVEKARGPQLTASPSDPLVNQTLYAFTGQHIYAHGNLNYGLGYGRVSGGATVRTNAFHYTQSAATLRVNTGASFYANVKLWRGSGLGIRHELNYAPIQYHYQTEPFPGQSNPAVDPQGNPFQSLPGDPSFDPALAGRSVWIQRTTIDFNQPLAFNITKRLSVNWGYGFQGGSENLFGQSSHNVRVGLVYQLGKGLGLRSGYSHGFARYKTSETESEWASHGTIDAGLDFNHQLSFLRRMTLSFWTGIATIQQHNFSNFTGIGGVGLNWNISRDWNAGVNIGRNVQFVDAFQNITIGNNLNGHVNGMLTSRLAFDAAVGMWSYDVAGSGDTHVQTLYSRVGVRTPLTRLLSLGFDYSNAFHSIGENVAIYPGVPRERNRHGVRVNVSMFAPLFSRTRRQQ